LGARFITPREPRSCRQPKGALFLDRDGVINAPPIRKRYITRWEEFRFLPGVFDALRKLRKTGRKIILVSNQAGVGRGVYPGARLQEITRKMRAAIQNHGGKLHAVYYCTHTPERKCRCRKPRPGLLLRAARRFSLDMPSSIFVGDNATDIETGRAAGCRTVLVLSGVTARKGVRRLNPAPDFVARDLSAAARWIARQK